MSSHYVTGKNGIDHLAKSLVHSRKGTTQITATQSVDTDDETLAVLSVSCDWQIKTAGDAPLSTIVSGSYQSNYHWGDR